MTSRTYRVAAAALIDQIDRALCGAEGEPHRAAVKSAIVGACRRLGCRGYSPLEWSPEHLRHELSEDNVIEAWLLAKLRTGIRAVVTRATPADADVTGAMGGDGWRSRGPRLWEADDERTVGATVACAYERAVAEAGIAQWGDMLDAATGEIVAWDTLKGRIGDTTTNNAAYRRVRAHLETTCGGQWRAWKADAAAAAATGASAPQGRTAWGSRGVRRKGAAAGDETWEYTSVKAARRAPASFGG